MKEFDNVKLKDGREGVIVDVLDDNNFIFEYVEDGKYKIDTITNDDYLKDL